MLGSPEGQLFSGRLQIQIPSAEIFDGLRPGAELGEEVRADVLGGLDARATMEADALAGLAEAANADADPEHRRADAQGHPASALVPPSHVLAAPSGLPPPARQLGAERLQQSLKRRADRRLGPVRPSSAEPCDLLSPRAP
ncbi:hypothetical protein LCGC14_2131240 [marine sediment metagenome]|uniref:Uncharacterized protein n=1 Tax=marine sediment metagenome TaxID=412755 RepID=A0A0F9GXG7_9ZZZZ